MRTLPKGTAYGGCVQELICNPKYTHVTDINIADANGLSPIMLAVQYERTKMLYYLLEAGADVEQQNREGKTVLSLLNQWMSERGSDLRLEKEVINHALREGTASSSPPLILHAGGRPDPV
jgi:hypothetical protein